MPPIIQTLLHGLFLLLLYVFVARAVRAVLRDLAVPARRVAPPRATPARRRSPADRPRPRRPPGELVVHVPDGRPEVLRLDGSDISFGRSEDMTVRLTDPYVSDRHARVYRDKDAWVVDDLGSTNGTFLNQVKVTGPTPIAAGDQLGIGKTVVEVRS